MKYEYIYTDEDGNKLLKYTKIKFLYGYDLHICSKYNNGTWEGRYEKHRVSPILYNYQNLTKALEEGKEIFVVTSEQEVDELTKRNIPATTILGGLKRKLSESAKAIFKDATIYVINIPMDVDWNYPEKEFAKQMFPIAKKVKLLNLSKEFTADDEKYADIGALFDVINDDEQVIKRLYSLAEKTRNFRPKNNKAEEDIDDIEEMLKKWLF